MTDNIYVYKQNSIRIKAEGKFVYIDPFEMVNSPHDAALILITHDHYDHFDPKSIEKVANKNTILVVPEKMLEKAKKEVSFIERIEAVISQEEKEFAGIKFETLPAYNILKPFHPKSAGWLGYIICTGDKRIYIAGDTDATKEAEAVTCDVALVPIGGTYTMNVKAAADLINKIKPSVAIPVHYGSVVGSPSDGEEFKKLVEVPTQVELKIRF